MSSLETVEIKAFVPAKDFELSKQFYKDLGFTMSSSGDGVAYMHVGSCSFLLQDFYNEGLANNLMMHLLVKDVDAWWQKIQDANLAEKYKVKVTPPQEQVWRMKDFVILDPCGVLWRIAQNI